MDADKQPEFIANRIKELHTNVRHITQLAMSWFAFFVTVNYLTMGWLAKRTRPMVESINPTGTAVEGIEPNITQALAIVFIVQNVLGIAGLIWVLRAAAAMKREVDGLENLPFDGADDAQEGKPKSASIPLTLYIAIGGALMLVLLSLACAWVMII